MAVASSSDVVILVLGVVLAAVYLFKDQIFAASKSTSPVAPSSKQANGGGNPRDFIAKMKEGVSYTSHARLFARYCVLTIPHRTNAS